MEQDQNPHSSSWATIVDYRIGQLEENFKALQGKVGGIEASLAANTTATVEILDIVRTARGAIKFFSVVGRVLGWGGGAAVGAYSLWALLGGRGAPVLGP